MITSAATAIGGSVGILAGKLSRRNDWLANSFQRSLRLGMWLPFFILWGLPVWQSGRRSYWEIDVWLETIALGLAAASPLVMLAACYYHLVFRSLSNIWRNRLKVWHDIFVFALLISILWQLFLVTAWPWKWIISEFSASTVVTVTALVVGVELLINVIAYWRLAAAAEWLQDNLKDEMQLRDKQSLVGCFGTAIAVFIVWVLCSEISKGVATPKETIKAVYALLAGTAQVYKGVETISLDFQVSLLEIIAGLAVAATIALSVSETFLRKTSLRTTGRLFISIRVAPIALTP